MRLQAKRLQNASCDHSFSSTLGSSEYSATSLSTSICNSSTAASLTVSTCNSTATASSLFSPDNSSLPFNNLSSEVPSSLVDQSVSKVSNLKISNNLSFDPGISTGDCHKILVSNFSTMEEDCKDCSSSSSVSPKHEDPPNLNQFLATIANQITNATV
jgi:hypothetical protein